MSSDQRFSRDRRIRKRKTFLRVQGSGRKYRSSHFLLAVSFKSPKSKVLDVEGEMPKVRLGITVTTKIHKNAVQRNRIKRFVREYIRRIRERFTSSADLVVIAQNGATGLSFREVKAELGGLLEKSRLLEAND